MVPNSKTYTNYIKKYYSPQPILHQKKGISEAQKPGARWDAGARQDAKKDFGARLDESGIQIIESKCFFQSRILVFGA